LFRHNLIRDWLANLASEALLEPSTEKPNLLPDHPNHRPADVFLPKYTLSKPAAIDITITSPLQPTFQTPANALVPLQAAKHSEKSKHIKYDNLLRNIGVTTIPLAVEVFGGIGPEGYTLIKDLIKRKSNNKSLKLGDVSRFHFESLSIILQRTNARSILSRI